MCVQQEQDIYGGNEVMKPMHLSHKIRFLGVQGRRDSFAYLPPSSSISTLV